MRKRRKVKFFVSGISKSGASQAEAGGEDQKFLFPPKRLFAAGGKSNLPRFSPLLTCAHVRPHVY